MLFIKLFKLFVYVQVYIMDYYIVNKEMVKCDVYGFVSSEPESEFSNNAFSLNDSL